MFQWFVETMQTLNLFLSGAGAKGGVLCKFVDDVVIVMAGQPTRP